MDKKLRTVIIMGMLLLCTGSVSAEDGKEWEGEEIPPVENCQYTLEEYKSQELGLERAAGLCVSGGKVYICDYEASTVEVFDKELNYLQTIGGIGMGEGEFSQPVDVEVTEEYIYVLDAGNSRVQILTPDGEYEDEIELTLLASRQGLGNYFSLTVNEEKDVCVSTNTTNQSDNRIRIYTGDEKTVPKGNVMGCVFQYENTFYAADMMELYERPGTQGAQSGRNCIYEVGEKELKEIAELPYMCTPTDIMVLDGELYMITAAFGQIDRISMEGEVLEGIADVPEKSLSLRLAAEDTESFYVTNRDTGMVYYLHK